MSEVVDELEPVLVLVRGIEHLRGVQTIPVFGDEVAHAYLFALFKEPAQRHFNILGKRHGVTTVLLDD